MHFIWGYTIHIQSGVYRRLGELVAISVVQGGSGLHVFNSSVYQYLCGADVTTIVPPLSQIPDVEVREVLEQVHDFVNANDLYSCNTSHPCCSKLR